MFRECLASVRHALEYLDPPSPLLTDPANLGTRLKIHLIRYVSRGRIRIERVANGRREFVYHPNAGDALAQDLRNDFPGGPGQGAGNKYLPAFKAVREAGFNIVDFKDPKQIEIMRAAMERGGSFGTWSHPLVTVHGEWDVMALERHRIEAAERLKMPIVVRLTDLLTLQ